jgi:hypothetical protein
MDLGILAGVTVLLVWGWLTISTTAPGWVHLLLTAGVFLIIWRIVVRGTPEPVAPAEPSAVEKARRSR